MKTSKLGNSVLKALLLFITVSLFGVIVKAQVGNVIWEDNFDTFNTNVWTPNIGDGCDEGICGWGNAELEYYSTNNVYVEAISGESGNNALVLEAKNESAGTQAFTSGKVDSDGKLSVQYGLIEVRIKTPDLETGLWPAAWLLGTANLSWPAKGEIDMMEMGHTVAERARQGHAGADMNSYVGANAIFANEDGSVGSIAYDVNYDQPYIASTPMNDRFVIYRLYWEPTQMRYTVVDNGVEYDLYTNPLGLDPDGVTGAFTKPFFFLLNLAVGGNFTDAATNAQVTAPLPAKMYVDYVRVSEWNGYGTVETDYAQLVAETGTFGVFTETTSTNNSLTYGADADIYAWGGTLQDGTESANEGSEVIAWETVTANGWFGGGIASLFGKDMSNYVDDGSLKFDIKIPADVSFRIGITDNYTNESWLEFPANTTTYGLTRDGNWGTVEIPLADFAGLIAFQNINYMFAIASVDGAFPSSTFQFAVDDIVWDDGVASTSVTGVSVTPSSASLNVGDTQTLSASVSPSNATNQNISWSSNNTSVVTVSSSGVVTAVSAGTATVTATTGDGGYTDTSVITVSSAFPDPTKTYYIDVPVHDLRLAATGESEDAYTTSTSTTGADVVWQFVDKGNGYWHIQRAAGGTTPRLRTDNSAYADMQGTAWNGSYTYYELTEGSSSGTYFVTLPDGPSSYNRLQINNSGEVKMVSTASVGTWESFTFTEVSGATSSSQTIEAEDYTSMSGIQTESVTAGEDGILNVGWIDAGDWMDYTVDIPSSGTYTVNYRVASVPGSGTVEFQSGSSTLATTSIAATGGWQVWTTLSTTVSLSAGSQTVRLYAGAGGWNINWFEITNSTSARTIADVSPAVEELNLQQINVYPNPASNVLNIDIEGYENYAEIDIVDIAGKTLIQKSNLDGKNTSLDVSRLPRGVYMLRIYKKDASAEVIRFVK